MLAIHSHSGTRNMEASALTTGAEVRRYAAERLFPRRDASDLVVRTRNGTPIEDTDVVGAAREVFVTVKE